MLLVVLFKYVLNENKNVIVNVVLLLNIHKMVHHLHDLVHFVQHQSLNVLLIRKVLFMLVSFLLFI
jgi:hypothetical protein